MTIRPYVKDAGVWRTVTGLFVKNGGVWRTIQNAYVKDAGVWRQFYQRGFTFTDTISADTTDYNLSTKATNAGWDGVAPLFATVTINAGKVVGSSTTGAAFIVPSLPASSTVNITNNGFIVGRGGQGGLSTNGGIGVDGATGGLALSVSYATTIDNLSGTVGGGGGGGGSGASEDAGSTGGGGGGGAGRNTGAGGLGPGLHGTDGTYNTAGTGAGHTGVDGGDGGNGGGLGAAGAVGAGSSSNNGGNGGAAGACTSGNVNITWTNNGTRLGTLG